MNKIILLLCVILTSASTYSQVQFNAIASVLQGVGYYANHANLVGGGMSARYMIDQRFFIGGTLRTYRSGTTAYTLYNAEDKMILSASADVDMVFAAPSKQVRPYVGIGIGKSMATHMINYVRVYKEFVNYSLKAGTHIGIGKSTGFFVQLQYTYTDDGQPSKIEAIANPVLTKPISKYVSLDCGLYVRLYLRK
jgi:outer membrane protein W